MHDIAKVGLLGRNSAQRRVLRCERTRKTFSEISVDMPSSLALLPSSSSALMLLPLLPLLREEEKREWTSAPKIEKGLYKENLAKVFRTTFKLVRKL